MQGQAMRNTPNAVVTAKKQVWVQPRALAVNKTLQAFVAKHRRLLLIDISCPRGAQQQTHCKPLLLPVDGTDRCSTVSQTLLCIQCGQCQ